MVKKTIVPAPERSGGAGHAVWPSPFSTRGDRPECGDGEDSTASCDWPIPAHDQRISWLLEHLGERTAANDLRRCHAPPIRVRLPSGELGYRKWRCKRRWCSNCALIQPSKAARLDAVAQMVRPTTYAADVFMRSGESFASALSRLDAGLDAIKSVAKKGVVAVGVLEIGTCRNGRPMPHFHALFEESAFPDLARLSAAFEGAVESAGRIAPDGAVGSPSSFIDYLRKPFWSGLDIYALSPEEFFNIYKAMKGRWLTRTLSRR